MGTCLERCERVHTSETSVITYTPLSTLSHWVRVFTATCTQWRPYYISNIDVELSRKSFTLKLTNVLISDIKLPYEQYRN